MKGLSGKLDHLGIAASLLCAVHCAFMPFLITILPLFGLEFLSSPWIEAGMLVLSMLIGISSLLPSYKKYHKNPIAILLLIVGLLFIFGIHLSGWDSLEPVVIPVGGGLIALAHYTNWRLLKKSDHEHV